MPVEAGPYGVTHHANAELATANSLVGAPGGNSVLASSGVAPAMHSTAPYKGRTPKEKVEIHIAPKASLYCTAPSTRGYEHCMMYRVKGTEYCVAHRRLAEQAAADGVALEQIESDDE
jgi:hypothetical protein